MLAVPTDMSLMLPLPTHMLRILLHFNIMFQRALNTHTITLNPKSYPSLIPNMRRGNTGIVNMGLVNMGLMVMVMAAACL
jgi:hypothetical protein